MTIKNFEPGDINLIKIGLSKASSGEQVEIDIRSQVLSMSIYEDINEPSIMIELLMVDSINLMQDYPIIGEEIIFLSYSTPARESPTKKSFLIFSIENSGIHPTSKASIYTIKAVSPIHFINSNTLIEKSFYDTIDNIVVDILQNVVQDSQIKKINFYAEKTKGLVPITIPRLTPFQAIDMLRQRAISAEFPSGGTFVFFENQFGLQFKSIEGLFKDGKNTIDSKTFTYIPNTQSDKLAGQYSFRNIIRFEHLNKFDSIKKISSGTIINEVLSFDVRSKQTETTLFKLAEKAQFFTSADKKASLPNSSNFIEQQTKATPKKFFTSKDTSKGVDFIDALLGTKQSFGTLLNQSMIRVLVHGDNYLSAGDLIKLNLPEVSGTTEKKADDRLLSGNYLVARLRHLITLEEGGKPKHSIAMDCVRMGYK